MKNQLAHGRHPSAWLALAAAVLVAAACSDAPLPSAPDTGPGAMLDVSADRLFSEPFELEYLKVETGNQSGAWTGRIWGDFLPTPMVLQTQVYDLRVTGKIWHIKTYWTVSAGTRSFRAELAGTVNTATGELLLNGTIVSGFLAGSQVHNEGKLTQVLGSGATVFEGDLRIMPTSAH